MDSNFIKLLDSVIATGPVAVLLIIAIWWQTKGNQALVTQLNAERAKRLDAMDKEIDRQRQRSEECEKDRLSLHRLLADIQAQHQDANPHTHHNERSTERRTAQAGQQERTD